MNLPLYAIATDLAGAHVLDGARNFIRMDAHHHAASRCSSTAIR